MQNREKKKFVKFFVTKQGKAHIYTKTIKGGLSYDKKSSEKILCVAMCLIMCGSTAAMALTVDSPDTKIVEPAYENISANSCSLKISGINIG